MPSKDRSVVRSPPSAATDEPSVQFSRFAPVYDRFMNKYVNYGAWVQYVQRIFRHYACRPGLLLDLACGTGIPTTLLAREGYRLIAVDRSEAMLAVLAEKVGNFSVRLVHSDMRDFTLPEPVDAGICLYDSMNYLLTQDDLTHCLRTVYRHLKPEGLFAFDMNTIHGLATYWGDRQTVRDVEDIHSVWDTRYDPETRISSLRLTFSVLSGRRKEPGPTCIEVHEERGYSIEEVTASLRKAGFAHNDFFQHGTFHPPGPTTSRMMIVARP
jgi:ubiquinone/menaquinone biosynthesis C-methylase UbiE